MENNKRKFFKIFGGGALGLALLSLSPIKLSSKVADDKKFKVSLHPDAVGRKKS